MRVRVAIFIAILASIFAAAYFLPPDPAPVFNRIEQVVIGLLRVTFEAYGAYALLIAKMKGHS